MTFLNDTLTYGLNFKKKIATGLNKSGRTAYFGQVLCYDNGKLHASSTTVVPGTPNSHYYIMTDHALNGTSTVYQSGFSGLVVDAVGKADGEQVNVQVYGIGLVYVRPETGGFLVPGTRLFVPTATTNVARVLDVVAQSTSKVVAHLNETLTVATSAWTAAGLAEGVAQFPVTPTDTVVMTNYSIQLCDVLFNGIEGIGR